MFNIQGLGSKKSSLKPWAAAQWYLNIGSINNKKVISIKEKQLFVEESNSNNKTWKTRLALAGKFSSYILSLGTLPAAAHLINWIYSSVYKIEHLEKENLSQKQSQLTKTKVKANNSALNSSTIKNPEKIKKLKEQLKKQKETLGNYKSKIDELEQKLSEVPPPLPPREYPPVFERCSHPNCSGCNPTTTTNTKQPIAVNNVRPFRPLPIPPVRKKTLASPALPTVPIIQEPIDTDAFMNAFLKNCSARLKGLDLSMSLAQSQSLSTSWMDPTNNDIEQEVDYSDKTEVILKTINEHIKNYGAREIADKIINTIVRKEKNWKDLSEEEKVKILKKASGRVFLMRTLQVMIGEQLDHYRNTGDIYFLINGKETRDKLYNENKEILHKVKDLITIEAVDQRMQPKTEKVQEEGQDEQKTLVKKLAQMRKMHESQIFDTNDVTTPQDLTQSQMFDTNDVANEEDDLFATDPLFG